MLLALEAARTHLAGTVTFEKGDTVSHERADPATRTKLKVAVFVLHRDSLDATTFALVPLAVTFTRPGLAALAMRRLVALAPHRALGDVALIRLRVARGLFGLGRQEKDDTNRPQ